jgi:16S rRNA U516 pseudouridylate synthase RsuA-like enzyme
MPRLHKRFDNALLMQIRNAVYYGGANYEIAERIGVDRKTWYHWRKNENVRRAIKEGINKRKKMMLKKIGFTIVAISEIENNQEK